ncbi:ribonuclease R [Candidatus Poribacteria bacterium]|nr:ribonuclease R [Candidatus Poribacteria bacterium]
MEKLKEKITLMLRKSADRPLKMKDIAHRLEIGDESLRKLKTAVKELVEAGELVQTRGKLFGVPEHMNLVVGNYIGHPDGYGFVQPLPRPGQVNLPDIYVSGRDIHGSMHGDKVVVRVAGHLTSQRLRGEIIRVLERAHLTLVGYYEKGRNFGFVVPIDDRIPHHIYVNFADALSAQVGQVVVTEITEYPSSSRNPEGKIIEVLGERGEPGLDTELLIRKHGLPAEFPPKVTAAAEKIPCVIPEAERRKRADLTGLPMVTIDPVDAKDFDDAVSLEISEKGNYLLGVHIADVSYYVKPSEALDDEAYNRATTIYLEDRVLPMLPERISNDLCSLREKVDRLAMSVTMELDSKGNLIRHEIQDSIIRVNHRMTYDNVLAILEGDKELTEKYADFAERFRMMNGLAQILRAKRIARGSLDFNFPEARAIFDHEGEVVDIVLQKHSVSHELIEEFMLLANETVARHVTSLHAPMMYRIHEEPNPEKMGSFREFIGSLGFPLSEKDSMTPRGLQRISREAQGRPEESLINYLMLRSLKEARYSSENAGHFGLASECYTHFTSPIRRYPDLIVHRIVRMLREGGVELVQKIYGEGLERIAEHASRCEREAMEAERESLKTKQLMFMSGKLGEIYDGRITGVQSYGLFVELVDSLAEGMVRVSTLEDDYYAFIEEKHCLQGEHTGKCYRLGDKITVQVVSVDTEKRRMDFILVDQEAQPLGMPKKKGKGAKQGMVAAPGRHGYRPPAGRRGRRRKR